jgi:glyoxylate utilization-related uncharacterized protein
MISKENAQYYLWGKNYEGWHLFQKEKLSIVHERIPAKTSTNEQGDPNLERFLFVLFGKAIVEISGKEEILEMYEGLEIPATIPYCLVNKSEYDLEYLLISQSV